MNLPAPKTSKEWSGIGDLNVLLAYCEQGLVDLAADPRNESKKEFFQSALYFTPRNRSISK